MVTDAMEIITTICDVMKVYTILVVYSTVNCEETCNPLLAVSIDGFQMSINHPTSGGQTHDQEAAVQRTFHLERNKQLLLSFGTNSKDLMFSLYFAHSCTKHRPDSCPLEVKPRPMKPGGWENTWGKTHRMPREALALGCHYTVIAKPSVASQ